MCVRAVLCPRILAAELAQLHTCSPYGALQMTAVCLSVRVVAPWCGDGAGRVGVYGGTLWQLALLVIAVVPVMAGTLGLVAGML